jgi:hypothetical protein
MNSTGNAVTQNVVRADELSKLRLNVMRAVYLLTFLGLAPYAWQEIVRPGDLEPMRGVAISFWAAYSTLMLLGVRYPVKILPLLILQLFYKSIWILGVAFPLWSGDRMDTGTADMLRRFSFAVIVDLIVIPWPYVLKSYLKDFFKIEWLTNRVKSRLNEKTQAGS